MYLTGKNNGKIHLVKKLKQREILLLILIFIQKQKIQLLH